MALPSFIPLILILAVSAAVHRRSAAVTHRADVEALKSFKASVDPGSVLPGSCLSSWDFAFDPCDSLSGERFTCGFACAGSRVTELTLDQAGYSGSLSSTPWGSLGSLQILDVSNNNFSGFIPDSLSNLTQLRRLGLSRNSLAGFIPDSLGWLAKLEELYLDGNGLVGPVPETFNGLSSLTRLEIQGNRLTGELPDLSRLSSLFYFDASENAISGEFPTTLPASLIQITMRNNQLKGSLPGRALSGLGYLQVLDLSFNELTGSVPASLFTHRSLQQLVLSNNRFVSVETPASLGSGLIAVDLSSNELSGFLPAFMGLMPRLAALNLENNRFTGMIPVQYGLKTAAIELGITPFERLLLGKNYLFGAIPGPFADLKPGSVEVSLVENCLLRCPAMFFFCNGGEQRPLAECRSLYPVIPLKG